MLCGFRNIGRVALLPACSTSPKSKLGHRMVSNEAWSGQSAYKLFEIVTPSFTLNTTSNAGPFYQPRGRTPIISNCKKPIRSIPQEQSLVVFVGRLCPGLQLLTLQGQLN